MAKAANVEEKPKKSKKGKAEPSEPVKATKAPKPAGRVKAANPFGSPSKKGSKAGFDIDLTSYTGSAFQVPVGKYKAKLIDIEQSTSKAGSPMLVWAFKIIEGKHAKREFKTFTVLGNENANFRLDEVLQALGYKDNAGKKVRVNVEDVINTEVWLDIEDTVYNDKATSSIKSVLHIDTAESLPGDEDDDDEDDDDEDDDDEDDDDDDDEDDV